MLFDDLRQGLSAQLRSRAILSRSAAVANDRHPRSRCGWSGCSARRGCARRRIEVHEPSEAELVRHAGGLIARTVASHHTALRLFDHFFARIARASRGATGTVRPERGELWQWLERHAAILPQELDRLKTWYADAHAEREAAARADLQNLLDTPGTTAENMNTAVATFEQSVQRELARVIVGAEDVDPRAVHRAGRARARAGAGRARPRQDAARQDAGARARRRVQAHPGHAGPHAERHHRRARLRRVEARVRVPPRSAVRGRGAGRRDQPHRPEDAVRAARGDGRAAGQRRSAISVRAARRISWCSPRRTRASSRAPIRCRNRSSTASCCASTSTIPSARRRPRSSSATARELEARDAIRRGHRRRRSRRCCTRRAPQRARFTCRRR